MDPLVTRLMEAVGRDSLLTQEEAAERTASLWRTGGPLRCKALLRPKSTTEVAAVLAICHEAGQTVVPHGGLTGVVGGTTTTAGDIALTLERMNRIDELDMTNKTVTVQAGIVLQELQQAVAGHGLLFPLDLGAKGSCTIGGNIATNAGGLQAIRYGVMRQLVLGLEVVLADGTVLSSMNKLPKNNAGYDLKQLFIGSEGTLGVVTRAILKLEDAPLTRNTAFVAFNSFGAAHQFLHAAKQQLGSSLTSFEIIWQDYYRLMTSAPSSFRPPLPQHYPFYVLIETLGQHPATDTERFEGLIESYFEQGLVADAAIASNRQELDWFWGIREKVEFIFSVHTPVFLFDVSLPVSAMEQYVNTVNASLTDRWEKATCYVFGHMGDGNLHLFVSCGTDYGETMHEVYDLVFAPLQGIGGSITAEHGIGLEKKPWLQLSRTPEEIRLMQTLKKALDPKNILNRGKVISL